MKRIAIEQTREELKQIRANIAGLCARNAGADEIAEKVRKAAELEEASKNDSKR